MSEKEVKKVTEALGLQCNSVDCQRCPYWEVSDCKRAVKSDAAALIKRLVEALAEVEGEEEQK